jgi:hypothetical protein
MTNPNWIPPSASPAPAKNLVTRTEPWTSSEWAISSAISFQESLRRLHPVGRVKETADVKQPAIGCDVREASSGLKNFAVWSEQSPFRERSVVMVDHGENFEPATFDALLKSAHVSAQCFTAGQQAVRIAVGAITCKTCH